MPETAKHLHITSHYSRILARLLRLQERTCRACCRAHTCLHTVLLPGDETRLNWQQQLRIIQNARFFNSAPELA